MFSNKKIMGITIAVIMVLTVAVGTAFAANADEKKQSTASQETSVGKPIVDKGIPNHEDLVKIADELGIVITGMTDEQIEAALKAYKLSHRDDTVVKNDKDDKRAGTTSHEGLVDTAKECGIDVAGMTDKQIEAALDAYKESQSKVGTDRGTTSHESLIALAKEFGIDTTGMTDEQIDEALKAFKRSHTIK